GPAAGGGRGGMRVAAGNAVRALLPRREDRRTKLPRLLDGLCLLRLHAPHERCRHEPAPALARAVVARGGGGGRQLNLRLTLPACGPAAPASRRAAALARRRIGVDVLY